MTEDVKTEGRTPWRFGASVDDSKRIIIDARGDYVASVQIHQTPRAYGLHDEARRLQGAVKILTAVNERSALLRCEEALRDAESWLREQASGEQCGLLLEQANNLRAALTLLDEERK